MKKNLIESLIFSYIDYVYVVDNNVDKTCILKPQRALNVFMRFGFEGI